MDHAPSPRPRSRPPAPGKSTPYIRHDTPHAVLQAVLQAVKGGGLSSDDVEQWSQSSGSNVIPRRARPGLAGLRPHSGGVWTFLMRKLRRAATAAMLAQSITFPPLSANPQSIALLCDRRQRELSTHFSTDDTLSLWVHGLLGIKLSCLRRRGNARTAIFDGMQGYLAHKKLLPPRTLQYDYA